MRLTPIRKTFTEQRIVVFVHPRTTGSTLPQITVMYVNGQLATDSYRDPLIYVSALNHVETHHRGSTTGVFLVGVGVLTVMIPGNTTLDVKWRHPTADEWAGWAMINTIS